jgi:site-specific recombinase XerD
MTSIKAQLNTYRATKNGAYPLVFQILHKRKKKVIYSSYHLRKDCFDPFQMKALNRRGKQALSVDKINEYIDSTLFDLKVTLSLLEEQKTDFSVSDIVDLYRSNQHNNNLLTYIRKQIVQLKESGRIATSNAYQSTLNRVINYVDHASCFSFGDLTVRWLNGFISSLQKNGLKSNSINFYIRILRAVYNRACNEGIPGTSLNSPFRKITLKSVKTVKRAITGESIREIFHVRVENNKRLELSKDLFLFSFYCRGMPFVDMAYLKYSNISNNTIYYQRSKTKQPLQIKIVEPLRLLIEKYRNDGDYVLPILCSKCKSLYNQYRTGLRCFNNSLKNLSVVLSLPVKLTSYVARHTWATLAKKMGIPVSVISEGLGHHSEKITYTYLGSLDASVIDSANKKISELCI